MDCQSRGRIQLQLRGCPEKNIWMGGKLDRSCQLARPKHTTPFSSQILQPSRLLLQKDWSSLRIELQIAWLSKEWVAPVSIINQGISQPAFWWMTVFPIIIFPKDLETVSFQLLSWGNTIPAPLFTAGLTPPIVIKPPLRAKQTPKVLSLLNTLEASTIYLSARLSQSTCTEERHWHFYKIIGRFPKYHPLIYHSQSHRFAIRCSRDCLVHDNLRLQIECLDTWFLLYFLHRYSSDPSGKRYSPDHLTSSSNK